DLSSKFAVRIEALRFFLRINAAQPEIVNAFAGFGVYLPRYPGKGAGSAKVGEQIVRVNLEYAAKQAGCHGLVGNFAGHREKRIDGDGHRQFLPVAVVDDTAAR